MFLNDNFHLCMLYDILYMNDLKNIRVDTSFVGYGHYKIMIRYPDGEKAAISGDMDLIRRLKSEDETERKEATVEAIAYVESHSL